MDTSPQSELSERELEILRLVATGASNKEIASRLFISTNTVKVHLRNIFTKINAASRTEAAMYAVRIGLVQGAPIQLSAEEPIAAPTPEQAAATAEPSPSARAWPRWLTPIIALILIGLVGLTFALGRNSSPPPTTTLPPSRPATATAFPRWQTLTPIPTARRGLALATFENKLFAIGGETSLEVTGFLEAYDLNLNTWTTLTSKPTPVTDVLAAVINGLIYVPGGRISSDPAALTDRLDIYNPVFDQWFSGAALPYPVSAYALQSFEGRLYLFGGWDGDSYLSNVYMYDPVLDTWQERTPMPTPRAFSGAAAAGGKIYVIGGQAGGEPLSVNEIYSPARDTGEGASAWESGFPIPDARLGFQVATIADTIYILGGVDQPNISYGLIYIPQGDTWQSLEASPKPLGAYFGLTSIGPQLYIVGGEVENQLSNQNLAYQALITFSIPIIIK